MLVKKTIIDICKSLDFNPNDYCVGFGSALVLYGIKYSTPDIDINVSKALFSMLSKRYEVNYAMFNEPYINIDGIVEVFIEENNRTKASIEGIPVYTLNEIIQSKKRLGRPKDIEDIKLIEEYINNKVK